MVFVANNDPPGLYAASADTFQFTLIPDTDSHSDIQKPHAIDYDPVDNMVYWTDTGFGTINRVFPDGTGHEIVIDDLQGRYPSLPSIIC